MFSFSTHPSFSLWSARYPEEICLERSYLNDGMTSQKRGLAAEYYKMAATMFKFWASLETNFIRKTCTLETETWVSG